MNVMKMSLNYDEARAHFVERKVELERTIAEATKSLQVTNEMIEWCDREKENTK